MASGGYPAAYRSGAGKYATRVPPNGAPSSQNWRPRGVGQSALRRGFQTPLNPFAPLESIPPEKMKWQAPTVRTPIPLAVAERAAAEAMAVRTISNFGIPGKAIAVSYVLYKFLEVEVPAPELMNPGDPLPFNPPDAGWVHFQNNSHPTDWYPLTPPGDWFNVGSFEPVYWQLGGVSGYPPPTSPLTLSSFEYDTSAQPRFQSNTNALWDSNELWDNVSPFYETNIFPNSVWYKPEGAPDVLTRPDLWIGPTRIEQVPQYAPVEETIWTRPRWNSATEASYHAAPQPAVNPVADPPPYYHGTRPNTAVAVIRQPSTNPRARPRARNRRPRDWPRRHRMARTKRYEREKKFIANVHASSALGKLVNFTTETVDALEAIWDALPDRLKSNYGRVTRKNWTTYEVMTLRGLEWHRRDKMPIDALWWTGNKDKMYNPNQMDWVAVRPIRPDEMARDIWKHWDQIDYDQAFLNILIENQNDQVYAKASPSSTKAGQQWLQATGRPVGFETGPAM